MFVNCEAILIGFGQGGLLLANFSQFLLTIVKYSQLFLNTRVYSHSTLPSAAGPGRCQR